MKDEDEPVSSREGREVLCALEEGRSATHTSIAAARLPPG